MNELKLKLKLKHNRKIIDAEVKENFGYSPSHCDRFDDAMKLELELLDIAKYKYPKVYDAFLESI